MTSTVTQVILDTLPQTPGQALAATTGGVIAFLVVALLIVRQLVAAADRPQAPTVLSIIDVAAYPLLCAFVIVVYERLQEILPLGRGGHDTCGEAGGEECRTHDAGCVPARRSALGDRRG